MATLTGQSIASSYEQLLHVDADGGGNSTTHVSVKDGDNGTTFALTLATDAVMITSTNRLEFGDDGTYIHQSADGVLDLVSDTEIEINATDVDMNGALDLDGTFTQDAGAVVFNEAGADYDFRIEAGGNANMLTVDSGNSGVGIGQAGNAHTLSVYDYTAIVIGSSNVANTAPLNVTSSHVNGLAAISIGGNDNVALYNPASNALGLQAYDYIRFDVSNTNDDKIGTKTERMRIDSAGDVTFTGDLIMADGKGIDFAAYTDGSVAGSTTSQILKDYEEGTFTPVITDWTITVAKADYTKIGNVVNIQIYLVGTGGTAPTSYTEITGLPFTTGTSQATLSAFVVDKSNSYKRFPCTGHTPGTTAVCTFDISFLENYESFTLVNDDQLQIGGSYIT